MQLLRVYLYVNVQRVTQQYTIQVQSNIEQSYMYRKTIENLFHGLKSTDRYCGLAIELYLGCLSFNRCLLIFLAGRTSSFAGLSTQKSFLSFLFFISYFLARNQFIRAIIIKGNNIFEDRILHNNFLMPTFRLQTVNHLQGITI